MAKLKITEAQAMRIKDKLHPNDDARKKAEKSIGAEVPISDSSARNRRLKITQEQFDAILTMEAKNKKKDRFYVPSEEDIEDMRRKSRKSKQRDLAGHRPTQTHSSGGKGKTPYNRNKEKRDWKKGLGESAGANISKSFSREMRKGDAFPQFRREVYNTKPKGGLFEEFVNNLYGIKECKGKGYGAFNKMLEAIGVVKEGRIVKEKFKGDAKLTKNVFEVVLDHLYESGDMYEATKLMQEIVEGDWDKLDRGGLDYPLHDKEKVDPQKIAAMKQRHKEKRPNLRKQRDKFYADKNVISDQEKREYVGMDILNHPSVARLPETHLEVDYSNRKRPKVAFPAPNMGDATLIVDDKLQITGGQFNHPKLTEPRKVKGFIQVFRDKFGEDPVFIESGEDEFTITNPNFKGWRQKYSDTKTKAMDADRARGWTTDETDASSSGAYVGALFGEPINRDIRSPQDDMEEILGEDEIEESTTTTSVGGGSGTFAYDANAFGKGNDSASRKEYNDFWFAGNKDNKGDGGSTKGNVPAKIGESDTRNKQYSGGGFVEIDDCAKIGHGDDSALHGGCSQGAVDGVVKVKKTKERGVVAKESVYYEIAKKTGKTVYDVKRIIERRLK